MKRSVATLFAFCLPIFFCNLSAQPDLIFDSWITGLSSPVDIANAGDGTDRLFIVERSGIIKIIEDGVLLGTPYLDITSLTSCCGEQGLLGLVFHPNYASNGYFYVNYTDNGGDTNISRFEVDPNDEDLGDPNSEVILLEIEQPYGNHNGGDLSFSPNDGYLYIAMGDGGSGGDPEDRAQDGGCLLGKILRIDVDGGGGPASPSQSGGDCNFTSSSNYTIPSDNPFTSDPNTIDEIWSEGWRNPWRFSFDSDNGNMWIADVGQNAWEEVDFEKSGTGGQNYGWRCYEGDHAYNTSGCGPQGSYIAPVFEYANPGGRSVTGGYVYRGSAFPNMVGYYVLVDYITEDVWTLFRDENGVVTSQSHNVAGINAISTFGVDENGEMYAASLGGTIYKVEDNSPLPVELSSFTGFHEAGSNHLNWTTEAEVNTAYFEIEKSTDGITFRPIGKVEVGGDSNVAQKYQYEDRQTDDNQNYYRLKIMDHDGSFEYSKIISISSEISLKFSIFPNPNDGNFTIQIEGNPKSKSTLDVYHPNGKLMLKEEFNKTTAFQKTYDFSHFQEGIYLLRFSSGDYTETVKLVKR
jgi:glucose/arabinose dehydrogenase